MGYRSQKPSVQYRPEEQELVWNLIQWSAPSHRRKVEEYNFDGHKNKNTAKQKMSSVLELKNIFADCQWTYSFAVCFFGSNLLKLPATHEDLLNRVYFLFIIGFSIQDGEANKIIRIYCNHCLNLLFVVAIYSKLADGSNNLLLHVKGIVIVDLTVVSQFAGSDNAFGEKQTMIFLYKIPLSLVNHCCGFGE